MSYAKLFSSIIESSLWSELKEVRLLFVSMLARADATGFIEASLPGLARIANLTQVEVEMALEVLEGPDKHSKNPEFDGRRVAKVDGGWMLLNYEAYRNRRSDEDRREYMRQYMQDYRRKHTVNNSANSKPVVNHGKPALAQAEAEAEVKERESAAPQSPDGDSLSLGQLIKRWNDIPGIGQCRKATDKRRKAFHARVQDRDWLEGIDSALSAVAASAFLCGNNDRGWRADIDWFLQPDSLTKVMEGKYSSNGHNGASRKSEPAPIPKQIETRVAKATIP